jgi:hypothetical protein
VLVPGRVAHFFPKVEVCSCTGAQLLLPFLGSFKKKNDKNVAKPKGIKRRMFITES